MERNKKVIGFLFQTALMVLLLMGSLPLVNGSEGEVEETRAEYAEPEIELSFSQEFFQTTAEPEVIQDVKVTGTVVCTLPDVVPDNLHCYVDVFFRSMSWTPSGSMHYFFNKEMGSSEFDCFFRPSTGPVIPAGETINISVWAVWSYPANRQQGDVPPVYSYIEITPFGRVLINSFGIDDPSSVPIGDELKGRLEVRNRGNDEDVITLEVVSAPPGIEVILEDDRLVMDFWEVRFINISILQKDGSPQEGEIVIRAECSKPGKINSRERTLGIKTTEKKDDGSSSLLIGISVISIVLISVLLIRYKTRKK